MSDLNNFEPKEVCKYCSTPLTLNPQSGDFECIKCAGPAQNQQNYSSTPNADELFREQLRKLQEEAAEFERRVEEERVKRPHPSQGLYQNGQQKSSRAFVTYILIAINIVLFVISYLKAGSAGLGSDKYRDILHSMGGNFGIESLNGAEWRLVASMFLHGGFLHIAFNLYALYALGNIIERIYGRVNFLAIYFFTGIAGSILSSYNNPAVLGVGASGAVCGVFGVFLGYIFLQRRNLPPGMSRSVGFNALIIIVLDAAIGLAIPNIDNAAHLGGLVAGILAALFFNMNFQEATTKQRNLRLLGFVIAGTLLLTGMAKLAKEKVILIEQESKRSKRDIQRALDKLQAIENKIDQKMSAIMLKTNLDQNQYSHAADEIKNDIIPEWISSSKEMMSVVDNDGSIFKSPQHYIDFFNKYIILKEQSLKNYQKFFETSLEAFMNEAEKLKKQYEVMKPEDFM